MSAPVAVVGAGSWGTAFAGLVAAGGTSVRLLARDPAHAADIAAAGRNARFLPDFVLPERVAAAPLDDDALADAELIVFAAPSRATEMLAARVAAVHEGPVSVLNLAKGLDPATARPLSETWRAAVGERLAYCMLTGPNHAEEVSRGHPAATVVGGDEALAERVQRLVNGEFFRVYVNDDLIGLELGAAAKNVIALAAGISDGLGYGDNTKASLMTRGLAEMTRLGVAAGAKVATFLGLAGMGDLVATCTSRHSRNRRAGELLARGVPPDRVEEEVGQVVEGLSAAGSLLAIARSHGVELPITAEVEAVVDHGRDLRDSMRALMNRSPAAE